MKHDVIFWALLILVSGFALTVSAEGGDDILGLWYTEPGTEDGMARVEVVKGADGRYSGTIVWLEIPVFPEDDDRGMAGQTKVDRENPDPSRQNVPVVGLQIVKDFVWDGKGRWHKGTIYDPANGKTYKCKARLTDEGVLKVRGYIGFSMLGRTTEWTRAAGPAGQD